jgi:hypothetical protein
MLTAFDEVELPPLYSALADGGPEWATAVVRSGPGGVISNRGVTLEDYQAQYEIGYADLDLERQQELRSFSILRRGMARGFRLLAPDDSVMSFEQMGILNEDTGEIELMNLTDGIMTDFYLVKYYADYTTTYTRRIVKPSPYADLILEAYHASDLGTPISSTQFDAIDPSLPVPDEPVVGNLFMVGGIPFTFDYLTGKLVWDDPFPEDYAFRITCEYHHPVVFTEDWRKFSVIDEAAVSQLKVGLREILPIELGIV